MRPLVCWLMCLVFLLAACRSSSDPSNPENTSFYLENKGSDTIVNLALAWAERYQSEHSEVRISVTGGGSGTGIAALINGTVDIANASRRIKAEEIQQAQAAGFEPVEHVIARDAIAIIVHPSNPIYQLTIQQIAAIYKGEITNWSELGGDDRPIVRLSRETNSGTHVYFLENVLRQGNKEDKSLFSTTTLLLPSSEGIINEIRQNPNAIGYDGLGYVPDDLKVVAVAKEAGTDFKLPTIESVNDMSYPIARDLYMYTINEPTGTVKMYLEWILSPEAQEIVSELGFVPIK